MLFIVDMMFYSCVADLWADHIANSKASFEILLQHDGDLMKPLRNSPRGLAIVIRLYVW